MQLPYALSVFLAPILILLSALLATALVQGVSALCRPLFPGKCRARPKPPASSARSGDTQPANDARSLRAASS